MKAIFTTCILWIFLLSVAHAIEVNVQTIPTAPVKGESFTLSFVIKGDSSDEPYISFDAGRLDVLGKENKGVSIRSIFVNGRLSTSRETRLDYELVAPSAGFYRIRNIKVELGNNTQKVSDISFQVMSAPIKKPDVFVEAVVPKKSYYVGEAIDLHYVVYNNKQVLNTDVKQFPKFTKAIKRDISEKIAVERVSIDGQVYEKTPVLHHVLFPEASGKVRIGSLRMQLQVLASQERGNDPFSSFGFSLGGRRSRTVNTSSRPLEIEVLPLPAEGMPSDFTGLVGEHQFDLDIGKTKYLANEAIEFNLKVKGAGALESYNAPVIYANPNLEEFETSSDFQIMPDGTALKTFHFTLLGRGDLDIPEREISFSYFDPNSKKYITQKVKIPRLVVKGGGAASAAKPEVKSGASENIGPKDESVVKPLAKEPPVADLGSGVVAPLFGYDLSESSFDFWHWINFVLGFLLLILFIFILKSYIGKLRKHDEVWEQILVLQKRGAEHSSLFNLLSLLDEEAETRIKAPHWNELIEKSSLSIAAKKYFLELMQQLERKKFFEKEDSYHEKIELRFFKELYENVKR